MTTDFKQGDIIKLNFNPTKGHEQRGWRPALVVSDDEFNKVCGGMIRVAAITTNEKEFPLHVELPAGLPVYGKVMLDQERTIDSQAEQRNCQYACSVPDDFLDKIINTEQLIYKKSR